MQLATSTPAGATRLSASLSNTRRSASALRSPIVRQAVRRAAASQPSSSSGQAAAPAAAAATAPPPEASLLQRVLASCSLGDSGTLLLAAVLAGGLLLGVAEPALAAGGADGAHGVPQLLGDVAENEDFWGNVLRYISYFFSVLLGTAYIAIRPLIELMKRPGTAVLVVAGTAGLVYFVSFTVQASVRRMLCAFVRVHERLLCVHACAGVLKGREHPKLAPPLVQAALPRPHPSSPPTRPRLPSLC